jgi:hypothetical protein
LLEFGEQVLAKLTKPKPQSKLARKAGPKFVQATWLGLNERTGEHLVVARNGKAFRIRTVKRRPEEVRWQKKVIKSITATPRNPDPSKATENEPQEVEPVEIDTAMPQAQAAQEDEQAEAPAGKVETRPEEARELRLTLRMFNKFGWSADCVGCTAMQPGLPQRKHTPACRERMYLAMQEDDEDRELVTRAIIRQQVSQAKAESQSRPEGALRPEGAEEPKAPQEPNDDDKEVVQPEDTSEAEKDFTEDVPDGNSGLFDEDPVDTPELVEGDEDESEDEVMAEDERQTVQGAARPRSSDDHSLDSDKLSHKRRRRGNEPDAKSDDDELYHLRMRSITWT